jgi:hypothetical protein
MLLDTAGFRIVCPAVWAGPHAGWDTDNHIGSAPYLKNSTTVAQKS